MAKAAITLPQSASCASSLSTGHSVLSGLLLAVAGAATVNASVGWAASGYIVYTSKGSTPSRSPPRIFTARPGSSVKSSLDSSSYYPVISPSKMCVPPFQEDNMSELSIVFYHTGVSKQLMQFSVNVHQFCPLHPDALIWH